MVHIKKKKNTQLENLFDIEFGNDFLVRTPKAQFMKERIDQLDFIKIKNFSSAKDTVKRMKSLPETGRKYLQMKYLIKDCYPKYMKNS